MKSNGHSKLHEFAIYLYQYLCLYRVRDPQSADDTSVVNLIASTLKCTRNVDTFYRAFTLFILDFLKMDTYTF